MVTLDWSLERTDGVTLVALFVAADRPCRVRVENRLDGPVWPPRRQGQPAAGWDGDSFAGRVPTEGRLTLGYATPAPPEEPPATVVSTEPAEEGDERADPTGPAPAVEPTPEGVVRDLGDPLVPLDGVPLPDASAAAEPTTAEPDTERSKGAGARAAGRDSEREHPSRTGEDLTGTVPGRRDEAAGTEPLVVPGAVRAWLRDVEERLAADRVPEEEGEGPTDPALGAAVAADGEALRRVRERVDALLAGAESGERAAEVRCGRVDRRRDDRGGR